MSAIANNPTVLLYFTKEGSPLQVCSDEKGVVGVKKIDVQGKAGAFQITTNEDMARKAATGLLVYDEDGEPRWIQRYSDKLVEYKMAGQPVKILHAQTYTYNLQSKNWQKDRLTLTALEKKRLISHKEKDGELKELESAVSLELASGEKEKRKGIIQALEMQQKQDQIDAEKKKQQIDTDQRKKDLLMRLSLIDEDEKEWEKYSFTPRPTEVMASGRLSEINNLKILGWDPAILAQWWSTYQKVLDDENIQDGMAEILEYQITTLQNTLDVLQQLQLMSDNLVDYQKNAKDKNLIEQNPLVKKLWLCERDLFQNMSLELDNINFFGLSRTQQEAYQSTTQRDFRKKYLIESLKIALEKLKKIKKLKEIGIDSDNFKFVERIMLFSGNGNSSSAIQFTSFDNKTIQFICEPYRESTEEEWLDKRNEYEYDLFLLKKGQLYQIKITLFEDKKTIEGFHLHQYRYNATQEEWLSQEIHMKEVSIDFQKQIIARAYHHLPNFEKERKDEQEKKTNQQVRDFKRIYNALREGQTGFFKTNFMNELKGGGQEQWEKIMAHAREKEHSRTAMAYKIFNAWQVDVDYDQNESDDDREKRLFKMIYEAAFAASLPGSKSNITGTTIRRITDLRNQLPGINVDKPAEEPKGDRRRDKIWRALQKKPK